MRQHTGGLCGERRERGAKKVASSKRVRYTRTRRISDCNHPRQRPDVATTQAHKAVRLCARGRLCPRCRRPPGARALQLSLPAHSQGLVAARLAISRAGIHCLACGPKSSVVKANSDQSRHGVLSTMHARSDVAPSGKRSVLLLGFRSRARLGGQSIPYQNDSSDLLRSLSFRRPGSSARRSDRLHARLRTLPRLQGAKRLPSNCSATVSTSSKYESCGSFDLPLSIVSTHGSLSHRNMKRVPLIACGHRCQMSSSHATKATASQSMMVSFG